MRALVIGIAIATLALPSMAASKPAAYWDGDHFLECLIGKGAVAMRHGSPAKAAIKAAQALCQATMEPEGSAAAADGDYVDYVIGVAAETLQAAADHGGIF